MSGQTFQHASGPPVLIVEDEAIVAMTLEMLLSDAGYAPRLAHDLPSALDQVRVGGLHAALVDANLGGTSAEPVADALADLGVPFCLLTGYDRQPLGLRHAAVPLLRKPAAAAAILEAVSDLVRPTRA